MDKRKLRLIVLGMLGVIILVIGIGAARIYTQEYSMEMKDYMSDFLYGRDYNELSHDEQVRVDETLHNLGSRRMSTAEKNEQFQQWLATPLKWIGIGFGLFLILTAALVVSRVISNRMRPPSGPS